MEKLNNFTIWGYKPFVYKTSRVLEIDNPVPFFVYTALQAAVITGIVTYVFVSGEYLTFDVPSTSVNAWVETPAGWPSGSESSLTYCSSPKHDYIYTSRLGAGKTEFVRPRCQRMPKSFLATKGIGTLSFATSIYEDESYGWVCGSVEHASRSTQCTSIGASAPISYTRGEQCSCSRSTTYYPQQVEELLVAFEHAFSASHHGISRVNSMPECTAGVTEGQGCTASTLDTTAYYKNGTSTKFPGGDMIEVPLKQLLEMAGLEIDDINFDGHPRDMRDDAIEASNGFPRFRATGMQLTVQLDYSNRHDGALIMKNEKNIDAKMSVERAEIGWAGIGQEMFWFERKVDPDHPEIETYHRLARYRQDVIVSFEASGKVYRFTPLFIIGLITQFYVFMSIAGVITDYFTFYFYRNHADVLRSKWRERISRESM